MRIIVFTFVSSLLCAAPAMAQGNPADFGRRDPAKEMRQYFAQVQKEVYEKVLLQWRSAAERDDAAALSRMYAENASYYPSAGNVVQTRSSIRDYFKAFLPTVLGVEVRLIDFGTSGDLAYLTTGVLYQVQRDNGARQQITNTDVIIARRNSFGDWQIESHLSRLEPQTPQPHPAAGE